MHMVSIVSHGTDIGIHRSVDQLTNSYTPLNVLLNYLIFNSHSSRVDHSLLCYPLCLLKTYTTAIILLHWKCLFAYFLSLLNSELFKVTINVFIIKKKTLKLKGKWVVKKKQQTRTQCTPVFEATWYNPKNLGFIINKPQLDNGSTVSCLEQIKSLSVSVLYL